MITMRVSLPFHESNCLVYTCSYVDQQDTYHATHKAKECYFLDQADNFSCTGHSFYILYTSSEGLGSLCWIRILIMCQCQNLHTSLSCTEYFSAFHLLSDYSSDPLPQLRNSRIILTADPPWGGWCWVRTPAQGRSRVRLVLLGFTSYYDVVSNHGSTEN